MHKGPIVFSYVLPFCHDASAAHLNPLLYLLQDYLSMLYSFFLQLKSELLQQLNQLHIRVILSTYRPVCFCLL